MKTIWIIGAGKFGLRAAKCLLKMKGLCFVATACRCHGVVSGGQMS